MKKYIILTLAGILVVGGVVLATDIVQNFYGNTTMTIDGESSMVETNLGAISGPDVYFEMFFHDMTSE